MKQTLKISTVNVHHHALLPIWEAVDSGVLPKNRKVKFLHLDSHPDLGLFGVGKFEPGDGTAIYERQREVARGLVDGTFDKEEALAMHMISNWVFTLVLQGLVDEIAYVHGHWCDQLPAGTFEMEVGLHKKSGLPRLCTSDSTAKRTSDTDAGGNAGGSGDFLEKALTDGYFTPLEAVKDCNELSDRKPFTLHIAPLDSDNAFYAEDWDKIHNIMRGADWILDIDLDFLSVQDTYRPEVETSFGKNFLPMRALLQRIDRASYADTDALFANLSMLIWDGSHLASRAELSQSSRAMWTLDALEAGDLNRSEAEELLDQWFQLAAHAFPDSQWINSEVITFGINRILMDNFPHHVSTLTEIDQLISTVHRMLSTIETPPLLATLATSRSGRFTPESQIDLIHNQCLSMLVQTYDAERDLEIYLRDVQREHSTQLYLDAFGGNYWAECLAEAKRMMDTKGMAPLPRWMVESL